MTLTGNTLADGRWSYTWNGENRLVVAESPDTKLMFSYDHQGRRFSKKTYDWDDQAQDWALAEERLFIYDGWNLVCEAVIDNAQLVVDKTHVWGLNLSGSEQGAGGVGGLLCSTAAQPSRTRYVAYDGNGNARPPLGGVNVWSMLSYDLRVTRPRGRWVEHVQEEVTPPRGRC